MMIMAEYKLLDTSKFDIFIEQSNEWIEEYARIQKEYDRIVNTLENNWKGKGAKAFLLDAKEVKTNITGIGDILKTMCDILYDCKDVFTQSDTSLGNNNRNLLSQ